MKRIEFKKEYGRSSFYVEELGVELINLPVSLNNTFDDTSQFELFLFENPYLNAENDIYELNINGINGRTGWIFPITALESNEYNEELPRDINFNGYRFVAYLKLLELITEQSNLEAKRITELFDDSIIICILHKETINENGKFDVNDYLISFYQFGYSLLNSVAAPKLISKPFEVNTIVSDYRNRKNLTLHKKSTSINPFLQTLLKRELPSINNGLLRFILLYQIIEQSIKSIYDSQFDELLKNFNDSLISKNDLRENLIDLSKEKTLIKKLFTDNPCRDNVFANEFKNLCRDFFQRCNLTHKQNLNDEVDYIYALRNKIVHNYFDLLEKSEELDQVIYSFEKLVLFFLQSSKI